MHPEQKKIYAAMTPSQKLRQVLRLRQSAWDLKAAWLRKIHPEWTEVQVQDEVRRIFLYARD